jgi:hypothetical protein
MPNSLKSEDKIVAATLAAALITNRRETGLGPTEAVRLYHDVVEALKNEGLKRG